MTTEPKERATEAEAPGTAEPPTEDHEALNKEVLHDLVLRDPFDVRGRVTEYVRVQALVLDPHRLFLRAVARMARDLDALAGEPEHEVWLAGCVRVAAQQLLSEDATRDQEWDARAPKDPAHAQLARTLKIDPSHSAAAAVAFNCLAEDLRRLLYAALVERRTLVEISTAANQTTARTQSQITLALTSLVSASYLAPNRSGVHFP